MESRSYKISISESIGDVSALLNEGKDAWCGITLAHGAGAGMTHSFMSGLARELAIRGVTTLRFNFPFTEAKKKRPDFAPVAEKTVEAVLRYMSSEITSLPLFASGKSFGGRRSSQLMARADKPHVRGLVFFGFPLPPINEPAVSRAEHLKNISKPMLFLQGTKDALARLDLIQGVCNSITNSELQTFEGADHAFMRGKQAFIPELAESASGWLRRHCGE